MPGPYIVFVALVITALAVIFETRRRLKKASQTDANDFAPCDEWEATKKEIIRRQYFDLTQQHANEAQLFRQSVARLGFGTIGASLVALGLISDDHRFTASGHWLFASWISIGAGLVSLIVTHFVAQMMHDSFILYYLDVMRGDESYTKHRMCRRGEKLRALNTWISLAAAVLVFIGVTGTITAFARVFAKSGGAING